MRLTQPKKNVFWITVIIAVAAVVAYVLESVMALSPIITICSFVALAVAYILLVLSVALKGF